MYNPVTSAILDPLAKLLAYPQNLSLALVALFVGVCIGSIVSGIKALRTPLARTGLTLLAIFATVWTAVPAFAAMDTTAILIPLCLLMFSIPVLCSLADNSGQKLLTVDRSTNS